MTSLYSLSWLPFPDWTQIDTASELSVFTEETNTGQVRNIFTVEGTVNQPVSN